MAKDDNSKQQKKKENATHRRKLKGIVVSDKADKTIVVAVNQMKIHPKYKKRYKFTKKYHAHDAENKYKKGDTVLIEESRPFSKTKKWRVIKKI